MELQAGIQNDRDATNIGSLGSLKLHVAINQSLCSQMFDPKPVTVRVYVVRAHGLKSKDCDNLSDPFVKVSLDAAVMSSTGRSFFSPCFSAFFSSSDQIHKPPWEFKENMAGVWPSGTEKQGQEVEQKVLEDTLDPYIGQVFEFRRVIMPGRCQLKVSVFDHDTFR